MKDVLAQTFLLAEVGGRRNSRSPTDTTPPSKPVITGVVLGDATSNLAWICGVDAETGIKQTRAQIRRHGTTSWTEVIVAYVGVSVASTTLQFTGLSPGTAYDHRVGTEDNAGNVTWSDIVTASTTGSSADVEPGTFAINVQAVQANEGTQFEVEIVRSGAGVSSPAADLQWQVNGLTEGAPTPSNGPLHWDGGENGPKSAELRAGSVTADRSGTFEIASVATTGSIQPTIGRRSVALTIKNIVGTGYKFNPGHYINLSDKNNTAWPSNTLLDEVAAMHSDVKGVFLAIMWGQLNTGNGVYNWTEFNDFLSRCRSRDLRVMFRVQDRSFGINVSSQYVIPADMIGNPAYGGGYFEKTGDTTGRMAKTWNAGVRARWLTFWQEFASLYDQEPLLEMVKGAETSSGITANFPSESNWQTEYNVTVTAFVRKVPAMWPHTLVCVGANSGVDTFIESMHADCLTYRCGTAGPDLVPTFPGAGGTKAHNPTDADRVYLGLRSVNGAWVAGGVDYRDKILKANEIQGPEMGGKEGSWTCAQFYDYALNYLKQRHMVWLRKTSQDTRPAPDLYWSNTIGAAVSDSTKLVPDVKTFLNAGGHPMVQTLPSAYS